MSYNEEDGEKISLLDAALLINSDQLVKTICLLIINPNISTNLLE